MTRKFLFVGMLVAIMVILAACGTAAEPAYNTDEVVADTHETEETVVEEDVATEETVVEEDVATEETVVEEDVATEEVDTATPVQPTNTPIPPTDIPEPTAVPTEEEVDLGADDPLYEAVAAADPISGENLFLMNGCMGCHTTDASEMVIVGPGQYNILSRAGERVEGEGPYTYLYNSIVNPNDYIVEGFGANIMTPTFGDMLSDEQIYDLIAYLATLHD